MPPKTFKRLKDSTYLRKMLVEITVYVLVLRITSFVYENKDMRFIFLLINQMTIYQWRYIIVFERIFSSSSFLCLLSWLLFYTTSGILGLLDSLINLNRHGTKEKCFWDFLTLKRVKSTFKSTVNFSNTSRYSKNFNPPSIFKNSSGYLSVFHFFCVVLLFWLLFC